LDRQAAFRKVANKLERDDGLFQHHRVRRSDSRATINQNQFRFILVLIDYSRQDFL